MSTELKPRTAKVVLFQGDDLERVNELETAAAEAAGAGGTRRVSDPIPGMAEAQARDEFVAEATERAITVVLRPMGRKKWRTMLNAHPPKPGDEEDKELGFNQESLADDLVPAALASPVFASAEERDDFLDSLSHGQFTRIYAEAYRINAEFGPSPKGGLSSRLERIYAETSE